MGSLAVQGTAVVSPRRLFGGPGGDDRPGLNGQLSAGKTKVIEEFIAASGEAVPELSTGHRLAHILTSIPKAIGTETARDIQAGEQSTAYNYK